MKLAILFVSLSVFSSASLVYADKASKEVDDETKRQVDAIEKCDLTKDKIKAELTKKMNAFAGRPSVVDSEANKKKHAFSQNFFKDRVFDSYSVKKFNEINAEISAFNALPEVAPANDPTADSKQKFSKDGKYEDLEYKFNNLIEDFQNPIQREFQTKLQKKGITARCTVVPSTSYSSMMKTTNFQWSMDCAASKDSTDKDQMQHSKFNIFMDGKDVRFNVQTTPKVVSEKWGGFGMHEADSRDSEWMLSKRDGFDEEQDLKTTDTRVLSLSQANHPDAQGFGVFANVVFDKTNVAAVVDTDKVQSYIQTEAEDQGVLCDIGVIMNGLPATGAPGSSPKAVGNAGQTVDGSTEPKGMTKEPAGGSRDQKKIVPAETTIRK